MVAHKKGGTDIMPSHVIKEMSENEQMYLVMIARLQEEGHENPVALSELANALSVLPVSVNQMIHKMDGSGLVKYYPYNSALPFLALASRNRDGIGFECCRDRLAYCTTRRAWVFKELQKSSKSCEIDIYMGEPT
ncbi:MAG: hypothetical protein ABIG63_19605 [Chloroflexota bacterium]